MYAHLCLFTYACCALSVLKRLAAEQTRDFRPASSQRQDAVKTDFNGVQDFFVAPTDACFPSSFSLPEIPLFLFPRLFPTGIFAYIPDSRSVSTCFSLPRQEIIDSICRISSYFFMSPFIRLDQLVLNVTIIYLV